MRKISRLCVGTALIAIPATGYAQDTATTAETGSDTAPQVARDGSTGEIIVTARRREENIQTVPVAVTAVSGEAVAKAGVVNVQDITRLAPSVSMGSSTRGGSVPSMSIRGISSADVTGGFDPSIGIYVNEVIQNRPNGLLSSIFDMDSVQVLRGPQGTLFGRNTVGGAILLTTKQPVFDFEGYLKMTYGNYDYMSAEGALNVPLADVAALRIAGRIDRRDGFVTSVTSGQDQSNLSQESFRASLLIEPAANLRTTTIFSFFNEDSNGTGATTPGLYPVGAVVAGRAVRDNNNVANDTNRELIKAAGELRDRDFYKTSSNELQYDRTKSYTVTNNTELELSDALTLKNIFGWRKVDADALIDADGSAARQLAIATENGFKQITEELQLQGDLGRLQFVLGGYYFKESGRDYSLGYTSTPFALIDNPPARSRTGGFVRNTSYSAFANLTYALTDTLKVSGGLRYTYDKRYVDLNSANILSPLSNPTPVCTVGRVTNVDAGAGPNGEDVITTVPADPCSLQRTESYEEPTYSVDVSWQATPDILLYAAHRHGYHSGALNTRATFNLASDLAEPEFLDDVEVGIKSRFYAGNIPMRLNVAAYYGWYTDLQRSNALPPVILNGVTRVLSGVTNAAKAHIQGVEVEYYASPFDGFDLSAFFAYNGTEYDDYFDSSINVDRRNDSFAYAPKYTGGATARYTFPVGTGGSEAALQASYFYTSSIESTLGFQGVYTRLPSYEVVNARAELNSIGGSPASLAVFANNLLDKQYYTGAVAVATVGAAVQVPGAPRLYGVELRFDF